MPAGEKVRHLTAAYLDAVRPWLVRDDEEKALFVSVRRGRQLAVRTNGQIVGMTARKSGATKTITPYTFRHSMAPLMLRNHADLGHIQAILSHASIASTELYTRVSLEDLKEVVCRANPHGRKG